ncbi:hypothetical protein C8R48DRAFT_829836 [Suillus tomentosus]|nr:hypothetical protein C8R48DRAFT_829836 [Suillus tomentosus]
MGVHVWNHTDKDRLDIIGMKFFMKQGVNVERSVLLISATSRGFRWKRHKLMSIAGSVRGLLYATSAKNLIVVSVPFRDGIKKVGNTSHLQVMHWVNQLGPDLFISSTRQFRKTYNLIKEMPAGAPALGYTFFREHPAVFAASNRLIRGIAGITANAGDVTGNVLVVKHCQSKKNEVMDCDDGDIPWVNDIMKQ